MPKWFVANGWCLLTTEQELLVHKMALDFWHFLTLSTCHHLLTTIHDAWWCLMMMMMMMMMMTTPAEGRLSTAALWLSSPWSRILESSRERLKQRTEGLTLKPLGFGDTILGEKSPEFQQQPWRFTFSVANESWWSQREWDNDIQTISTNINQHQATSTSNEVL